MQQTTIDGIELHLTPPDEISADWVGNTDVLKQLLACWIQVHPDDHPLHPRLIGRPGVGKTTLACAAAKYLNRDVYIFQATMDTRPEDLLITPVINQDAKIKYVASALVSAMINGGIAILDEGNRMGEKSWASLAPLLDHRRYIESIIAGIKIKAHKDFLFCATMNEDASTFEVPEYIRSRLQPQIYIDFADANEEAQIIKANMPFAPNEVIDYVVSFLQRAHMKDEPYSIRDGINITRMTLKLAAARTPESPIETPSAKETMSGISEDTQTETSTVSQSDQNTAETSSEEASFDAGASSHAGIHRLKFDDIQLRNLVHEAVMGVLGDDALRYLG